MYASTLTTHRPLLLRGARVVDGTSASTQLLDVLLADGKIERLGKLKLPSDSIEVVDLSGLTLAPGFIDIHSHSDVALLKDGKAESQLLQGVTTEVVGNCGVSCAPRHPVHSPSMTLGPALPADLGIHNFDDYLTCLQRLQPGINVAALVGHGALRGTVMHGQLRAATHAETLSMKDALKDCLNQGAVGMSSGLEYVPGICADTEELIALCECVAEQAKLYTSHIRNRDVHFEKSLGEAIHTARKAHVKLQVSHITPKFGAPTGAAAKMIEMIESARSEGIDAAYDVIPHQWGPTAVASVLPAWAYEGGTDQLIARLQQSDTRARIAKQPNAIWKLVELERWDDIVMFGCPIEPALQGMSIRAIAQLKNCTPLDAILDLLAHAGQGFGSLTWIGKNFSAQDTALLLEQSYAGVISDAITQSSDGAMHDLRWSPSTWGWAVRFLSDSLQSKSLPLEQAVYRLTGLPAQRLNLNKRGRIAPGYYADLVAFDPAVVSDQSSLASPMQAPSGIAHVWVNGRQAVRLGKITDTRAGQVIR